MRMYGGKKRKHWWGSGAIKDKWKKGRQEQGREGVRFGSVSGPKSQKNPSGKVLEIGKRSGSV